MKDIIRYLVCLFFWAAPLGLSAQVNILFQPAVNGKDLDGLFRFQTLNSFGTELTASLHLTVREERGGKILDVMVPSLKISSGQQLFNRGLLDNAVFKYNNTEHASILKRTGRLVEGEYEYCYELNILGNKPSGMPDYFESCFTHSLFPLTPLLLLEPDDKEEICNKKPTLIWQAPLPVDPMASYRVLLAEINEGQLPVEALSVNIPVFNIPNVRGTRMVYPAHLPELTEGKKYAWQVHYIVDDRVVLKSDIWTFLIQCENPKDSLMEDDSYRLLKPEFNGDYYVADRKLKFAIVNSYGEGVLSYSVYALNDPNRKISGLPGLKLINGLNKFSVDLEEHGGFKSGEHYQLVVQLSDRSRYFLRFTYKD